MERVAEVLPALAISGDQRGFDSGPRGFDFSPRQRAC
jgi:hypothetical protein